MNLLWLACSGYMSPEYIMHEQFSMKSDVYSFGVSVLEIISGKKNNTFIISYSIAAGNCGEDPAKRPNMTTVVPMLNNYIPLTQTPERPASFFRCENEFGITTNEWQMNRSRFLSRPSSSINEVSISETNPR
ncbi:hypothetical protein DITRI_Ditri07aG0060800 [Diplodiscus trichospermus]